MAVAASVQKGSLGLSEQHLPQPQETPQKVQSPPRPRDHQSSPWSWAGASLPLSPVTAIHRKGGLAAAACGFQQVPHPAGLKGA